MLGFAEYEILILENPPLEEKADHESCPGHAQYPAPHCFWLRGIHHYLSYRQIKRILSGRNRIGDPGTGDFFGGTSSPFIAGRTQLPAEDSSESGNSPGAQEFQPLEQFFPRGTVVGFDDEESVRSQEIL